MFCGPCRFTSLPPVAYGVRWFRARPESYRWAIEHEGRLIGDIRLDGANEHDRRASIAVGIFDRRYWGLGLGPDAIEPVLHYGFDELELHRIELRVLAFNERAIRAYEKCGFRREGVERESAMIDGVWHDDLRMSPLEDEFRGRQETGG